MERDHTDDESGFESLTDATGMDSRNATPAMGSAKEERGEDEPTGDEQTAVEGAAGIGGTNRAFGGLPVNEVGVAATDVPPDTDDRDQDATTPVESSDDRTDPRGY